MAAFGLQLETERPDDTIWIWPQIEKTVSLFLSLLTQKRQGLSGVAGLDYAALPVVAKATGTKLTRRRFAELQVMERTWLECLADGQ